MKAKNIITAGACVAMMWLTNCSKEYDPVINVTYKNIYGDTTTKHISDSLRIVFKENEEQRKKMDSLENVIRKQDSLLNAYNLRLENIQTNLKDYENRLENIIQTPTNQQEIENIKNDLNFVKSVIWIETPLQQLMRILEESNGNQTNILDIIQEINTRLEKLERQKVYEYAVEKNFIVAWSSVDVMKQDMSRIEMAKILVQRAESRGIQPLTTGTETWIDMLEWDEDTQRAKKAYQYGIMGQGISKFNPSGIVTRAQFITALGRLCFWNLTPAGWSKDQPYYQVYLDTFKEHNIIFNRNTTDLKSTCSVYDAVKLLQECTEKI